MNLYLISAISSIHARNAQKLGKIKLFHTRNSQHNLILKKAMHKFVALTSHQWVLSHKNSEPVLINSYTNEQYSSWLLPKTHAMICEYRNRQSLLLPNTPKIFLLECQSQLDPTHLILLVQNGQYELSQMVEEHEQNGKDVLDILEVIMQTANLLSRKYGPFLFTENMIRVVKGPSILLWIHQNYYINSPQFSLFPNSPDCIKRMIMSLLEILKFKFGNVRLVRDLMNGRKQFDTFKCILEYIRQDKARKHKLNLTPAKQVSVMIRPSITPKKSYPTKSTFRQSENRKHRFSFDSNSTSSESQSIINQLKRRGRMETLDTCLKLVERQMSVSTIIPDPFFLYWNDSLAQEFIQILNN